MVDYSKLEELLKDSGINKSELGKMLGISSRTIAKIGKGEIISDHVLRKIGEHFNCDTKALYKVISDNPMLQLLRDEKEAGISGGLYHELQVRMTYNSNHMEGSRLTEEQTRMIFETSTVGAEMSVSVDDILETVHHFRAIDYLIDFAEASLTEDMIKHLHYILKHDTKAAQLSWFAVGDYKTRPNMVGGLETTSPENVSGKANQLLAYYNAKAEITFEDIVEFHVMFERIHPFQDGNGRVGRLIAFKECLKHRIIPFIIEDSKKMFYYRGLANWKNERGYLIDTCLDGQDTVKKLMSSLEIKE